MGAFLGEATCLLTLIVAQHESRFATTHRVYP